MKNLKTMILCMVSIFLIPIYCFAAVSPIVITDVVKSTRINLGGADDVIINDVIVTSDGNIINVSFFWLKRTTNNPGEIDQIFVAIERTIIKTVFVGIPGIQGVSGIEHFSFQAPASIINWNLFVVMTPSYTESQGRSHYEIEGGGHRTPIASFHLAMNSQDSISQQQPLQSVNQQTAPATTQPENQGGVRLTQEDLNLCMPVCDAAKSGDLAKVRAILSVRPEFLNVDCLLRGSPLHMAAEGGHLPICQYLLDIGANINMYSQQMVGMTPLHAASNDGQVEVVRLLLDRGASIKALDWHRKTPLHGAVWWGHVEVVRLLLGRGAEVNARDSDGNTPLRLALWKKQKNEDIVSLLRQYGGIE